MIELPTPERPVVLVEGDCIERMRELEAASVQVVLTDPPAGIGFMGKVWDSFAGYVARTPRGQDVAPMLGSMGLAPWAAGFVVFMVDVWTEASRVLVPGGWVCAWALPKTSDLAGLALRLAGLEVVDMGLHLFGSGMPKGCNIGKQLDKEAWDGWNTQLAPGFECWHLARKPRERGLSLAANAVRHGAGALHIDACRVPRDEGVLTWSEPRGAGYKPGYVDAGSQARATTTGRGSYPPNVLLTHALDCEPGRCVDGCPCKALDEQGIEQGVHYSGTPQDPSGTRQASRQVYRDFDDPDRYRRYGDRVSASRFFPQLRYQAKAKRRDIPGRAATLSHPTHKHPDLMRWLVRLLAAKHWGPAGPLVLDPFAGSGTTLVACLAEGVRCIGIEFDPTNAVEARARLGAAMGDPDSARVDNAARDEGQLSLL